jgi:serine/threonine protein kinase
MRTKKTTNAKGIGQLFGDRFVFLAGKHVLLDISLRWMQLDPFYIVDEFEQETDVGFTIRSASQMIDFVASSSRVLDKWLKVFEKTMILTDVVEEYKFGKVVGSGSYGNVLKGQKYGTGDFVAIKAIEKPTILSNPVHLSFLKKEITALRKCDHRYIIRLHAVYEDEDKVYIVTDLCSEGDLLELVIA